MRAEKNPRRAPGVSKNPASHGSVSASHDTGSRRGAASESSRRVRCRAVKLVRHDCAPVSAAQLAVIDMALDGLGGEWVRARHGGYTECSECAGTEPHEQGAVRFEHPRDLDAIEEALPGFVVAPLTGRLAFPKYVAYLTHGGFHELYSNFDWRKVVAGRPATKPPTLKAVRRQVFDGELSPVEVGERWPDLYLRHARALEVDWTQIGRASCRERVSSPV